MRESIVGRMERHGGRARVTSAPGRRHRGRAVARGAPVSGPRVLIVDDHQLFRAGVRAELEPLLEIAGEASGVERGGRRRSRQHAPDVVLLDVHMPDGGGVEVIRRTAGGHREPALLPRPVGVRRRRGRDRRDPRRRARLRDEEHLRRGAGRRGPPRARRRRRLLPAPGRLRARRLRRARATATSPSSTRSPPASARCSSTSRAATCTRRSRCASTSRRRRWRRTCPPSCASCSSRAATS